MAESSVAFTTNDARYDALAARYRPVFDRIGADALEREVQGVHAHEQLLWLVDAGFAAVRVPESAGGQGARLSDVFRLIAELAEVDPNLAHVWRNHFSFVEDRRYAHDDPRRSLWLERLGRGEMVGGGWSESVPAASGTVDTRIEPAADGDGWVLNGAKYYSTGSVFADWITVLALDPDGEKVVALVDTRQRGVLIGDDWDGFGQRLTGSGSVVYTDVRVAAEDVIPYSTRYPYQEQFYQSVLHALLVGIGNAIVRDGVAALRSRRRSHGNGTTVDPTADPQILEVIGRLAGNAFAIESVFLRSIALVDAAVDAAETGATRVDGEIETESWIAVAQAQQTIASLVLESATIVFDALGSSGTSRSVSLDRHWRNARTLISHNPRNFKLRIVGDWIVNHHNPTTRVTPTVAAAAAAAADVAVAEAAAVADAGVAR
ncbi:acyl-CoA dehydrogenase family protein [Plantibacter sp. Mn2098]|uniref:acyl-CoA dehydrogenase family protein n=1 Tax=Plantibacter sp. Mn2098 TaxID=3395266 RepID=UPI003BC4D8AF